MNEDNLQPVIVTIRVSMLIPKRLKIDVDYQGVGCRLIPVEATCQNDAEFVLNPLFALEKVSVEAERALTDKEIEAHGIEVVEYLESTIIQDILAGRPRPPKISDAIKRISAEIDNEK